MNNATTYITTSIPYVNAAPHVVLRLSSCRPMLMLAILDFSAETSGFSAVRMTTV
ncbi:hypothetical protein GGE12_006189 [Rhizobium mongolense]|uniref:Uncharacterized protein n=1 Tax=Rhizobium mongolense TaxID=57676 RepID=A0A7W6WI35_9HYPH|nr:hypothetical protein [Rhizobium mongolense]